MILNLKNKTANELNTLLDKVKISDAPLEIRQKNIENIENALKIKCGNPDVLKDIEAGQPDIDDIVGQ